MTEPCDLSAVEARWLIGLRRLSPVELLASCMARIGAVNPAVNAVVAMDEARARDAARAAEAAVMRGDPLPPLHGLPLGIKDLEETAGLRTTFGSPLYAEHVPARDQGMVARLKAAGGIVLAKTNTPEFGAGANTRNVVYGATGNPFDPTRSAAGSSGGSAVALATGMVPLASGSDMGGSLRNPAAFNGVVGFRPSPGVVPNEARGLGWSHLGTLGPMARSVADLALFLSCMAGDDPRDPLAYTLPGVAVREGLGAVLPRVDLSAIRCAATEDFGIAPTESHVRRVFRGRIERLRPLFGAISQATPDCRGTDEAFATLRAINFVAAHAEKARRAPDKVGPNVLGNVADGLALGLEDCARALSEQTRIYQSWQRFFAESGVDVILSPGITISPRPWRELYPAEIDGAPTNSYFHWLALAYATTLVGHPSLVIPVGVDEAGLPFGLQIVGRRGADLEVLAIGAALEAALAGEAELARPRPDLGRLAASPPIASAEGFLSFA
jgi:Asp-tRNA(Asn)/Glu-tRNA(Gln) amidotransferase A subunit family amidase